MAARKKSAAKMKRKATKKAPAAAKRKVSAKKGAKRAVSRATAKKASSKASIGHVSVGSKPFTKSQLIATICDHTGVSRKEVVGVLESISHVINAHVSKQGPGIFSLPGLFKIQVVKKPATKARQGINPFTGETMMFKAKPASRRIKIRPLKQLKSMAA
jgi:nucleoid DNA-binding protein